MAECFARRRGERQAHCIRGLSKRGTLRYSLRHTPMKTSLITNPIVAAIDRRRFISRCGLSLAFFTVPGAFAEELTRTPQQTEGPFYPDKLPLDTDNDLLSSTTRITPAVGEVTHLTRQDPRRRRATRCATRSSRSGSATPTASTCTPAPATPTSATRTSRASAGS